MQREIVAVITHSSFNNLLQYPRVCRMHSTRTRTMSAVTAFVTQFVDPARELSAFLFSRTRWTRSRRSHQIPPALTKSVSRRGIGGRTNPAALSYSVDSVLIHRFNQLHLSALSCSFHIIISSLQSKT